MKKMLMLLSTSMMTVSVGTSIFGSIFISCRTAKNKKAPTILEEDDGNFEYGSVKETNNFSKDDFNKYVDSSLTSIISLLNHKFLDQSDDPENFDFISVFNSLKNKANPCNAEIWNKQSVSTKDYCIDAFLDDWTFSQLEQKDIDLIKSIFVSRKNESKKQKKQNQLDNLKDIKLKKNLIKDKIKNIKAFIEFFNSDNFKKNIDIDSQILKFMKKISNESISPLFLNVKSRFEQIFNNFINGTSFNDIKDLTDVNGQNLIAYIKKPENIKKMNDNFNSKTDDDKALMLFMIKLNYMYKYISSTDGNLDNGQLLQEALQEALLKGNIQHIIEKSFNYLKNIYEDNNNGEKNLEPLYCIIEGILYIIKQKFYKTKIDQPIENTEVKVETIFECIFEFISLIKGNENNNELKYFNFKDGKEFLKDVVLESSLLEGIFIENESVNKTNVLGSAGIVGTAAYYLFGMGIAISFPVGLITGGLAWLWNKTDNTSAIPININDNFKNFYNTSWLRKIARFATNYADIAKMIDIFDLENWMQKILNEYRKNKDYQEYIQTFDKLKDIFNNENNNFLKELQDFINQGGFKNILTDFFNLINKVESIGDNLNNETKKQEVLIAINNLFKSIGIDRQKKGGDTIVTGSVLKNLIDWINNPESSLDKTFEGIINTLEQECNQWNEQNFENQIDNLTKVIKDKKDIEIEYVSFEEIKDSNSSTSIIKLNYKLKLLTTNEVYNIEFKNKNFKKFPKNFKISKFEKLA